MAPSSDSPCSAGGSASDYVSSTMDLKLLGRTIRHNYVMLLTALLLTALALFVIIYIVYKIIESVRVYYQYYVRVDLNKNVSHENDDEQYDYNTDEDIPNDEYARIRSSMQRIESKYDSYNQEMTRHARGVLNREPDDLVDARILSREDDDYDYSE
jgi:capsular polysaccharide biosynthesis protein